MYEDYDEADDLEIVHEGGAEENLDQDIDDADDENQGDQAEEAQDDEESKKEVKPKRVVKNPQPKLNIDALKGKRGLTALEDTFANVKFQGKGHEEKDLNKIMKTYEYWCHRMFPKFAFDDCIDKLEKLGTKKVVQVYVKKIRLNMLFDDIEPALQRSDDENENNSDQANDQFDDLLPQTQSSNTDVSLTDEQQEIIRLNREKAMRLRQERLKVAQDKAQSTLPQSSKNRNDEFPTSDDELMETDLPQDTNIQKRAAEFPTSNDEEVIKNSASIQELPINQSILNKDDEFPNSDEEEFSKKTSQKRKNRFAALADSDEENTLSQTTKEISHGEVFGSSAIQGSSKSGHNKDDEFLKSDEEEFVKITSQKRKNRIAILADSDEEETANQESGSQEKSTTQSELNGDNEFPNSDDEEIVKRTSQKRTNKIAAFADSDDDEASSETMKENSNNQHQQNASNENIGQEDISQISEANSNSLHQANENNHKMDALSQIAKEINGTQVEQNDNCRNPEEISQSKDAMEVETVENETNIENEMVDTIESAVEESANETNNKAINEEVEKTMREETTPEAADKQLELSASNMECE